MGLWGKLRISSFSSMRGKLNGTKCAGITLALDRFYEVGAFRVDNVQN